MSKGLGGSPLSTLYSSCMCSCLRALVGLHSLLILHVLMSKVERLMLDDPLPDDRNEKWFRRRFLLAGAPPHELKREEVHTAASGRLCSSPHRPHNVPTPSHPPHGLHARRYGRGYAASSSMTASQRSLRRRCIIRSCSQYSSNLGGAKSHVRSANPHLPVGTSPCTASPSTPAPPASCTRVACLAPPLRGLAGGRIARVQYVRHARRR